MSVADSYATATGLLHKHAEHDATNAEYMIILGRQTTECPWRILLLYKNGRLLSQWVNRELAPGTEPGQLAQVICGSPNSVTEVLTYQQACELVVEYTM